MLPRLILCALLFTCRPLLAEGEDPSVKAALAPHYPPIAVLARLSGSATVRVVVDESGSVTQVEAISGHPIFRKAATEAAKKWRFEAASVGSRTTLLKFDFEVLPEKARVESETTFMPPYEVEVKRRPPESTVSYGKSDER